VLLRNGDFANDFIRGETVKVLDEEGQTRRSLEEIFGVI